MAEPDYITIEVVYALPDRQKLIQMDVPVGSTVRQIVCNSGLEQEFAGLNLASCALGIFGREVVSTAIAEEGDRIEIYRPLDMDPREARRQLAARGLTMGADPQSR